ncbi:MAG: hypothetical protein UHN47_11030 [Lachnospiraceae bacterium]|nr:hypothetical protein [Lachnospiraceae bacterium]
MRCLIYFLSEGFQTKLRILAQGRSERYEDTILEYKKLFLAWLKAAKYDCNNKECPYKESCNVIKAGIELISDQSIETFFDSIRKIYLYWIDSKSQDAIVLFTDILKEYGLEDFSISFKEYDIFFKGRCTSDILTKWDMFHIPFNKRYLISNQRYSLTGQPIVYAGRSVVDIMEELEVNSLENLKLSTIQPSSDMKVFDLRNNINADVEEIDLELFFGDEQPRYEERNFFKIILASICSFSRKQEQKNFSFCEEYVIPQLLAQIMKNNGYWGIVYLSTKKFKNLSMRSADNPEEMEIIDYILQEDSYKENIAIFTQIDEHHVYDKGLFEKLRISVPISVDKIEKISLDDLHIIVKEIVATEQQNKITNAEMIVSSFERIYNKINISGKQYRDTEEGQLHMYHLYEALNQILVS